MEKQTQPFEQREIYELQCVGTIQNPKTEYVFVSLAHLSQRRQSNTLRGSEYVRQPGESMATLTVDALLQRASAGLLKEPEAEPKAETPAPVAKTDLQALLQKALASASDLQRHKSLSQGHKLSGPPCDELHRLETQGDLSDPKTLARISELRAMAETLPHRTELCQQAHGRDLRALLDASQRFVKDVLHPHVTDLESRTRSLVMSKIRPYFDREDLQFHVDRSALMTQLSPLRHACLITVSDQAEAIQFTEKLLNALDSAYEFEGKHLAAK